MKLYILSRTKIIGLGVESTYPELVLSDVIDVLQDKYTIVLADEQLAFKKMIYNKELKYIYSIIITQEWKKDE